MVNNCEVDFIHRRFPAHFPKPVGIVFEDNSYFMRGEDQVRRPNNCRLHHNNQSIAARRNAIQALGTTEDEQDEAQLRLQTEHGKYLRKLAQLRVDYKRDRRTGGSIQQDNGLHSKGSTGVELGGDEGNQGGEGDWSLLTEPATQEIQETLENFDRSYSEIDSDYSVDTVDTAGFD